MRLPHEGAVLCLFLLATHASANGWVLKREVDGISIYNKPRDDSSGLEIRAIATIDAPPKAVWAVLRDYPAYKGDDGMPYTEEAVVIDEAEGGKVTYFYSMVGIRPVLYDYNIRIVDESDWNDGRGYFKSSWTLWDSPRARRSPWYAIRLQENQGYWRLEPAADGRQTRATYWLFALAPGDLLGELTAWGNMQGIRRLFRTLRDKSARPHYRQSR